MWQAGPAGVMTVFPQIHMCRNLGLTFVYFLGVSFTIAYLATIGLAPGADFMTVFRFVWTAGLLAFLAGHRWLFELVMYAGVVFTLCMEIGVPFLIWLPRWRKVLLVGIVLLHFSIGMFMGRAPGSDC